MLSCQETDGILWSSLSGSYGNPAPTWLWSRKGRCGVIKKWTTSRFTRIGTPILWIQANRAFRKSDLFLCRRHPYLAICFDARASHNISGCHQSAQSLYQDGRIVHQDTTSLFRNRTTMKTQWECLLTST